MSNRFGQTARLIMNITKNQMMLSIFGLGATQQQNEEPTSVEHKLMTKLQTRDENSVNGDQEELNDDRNDHPRDRVRLVINSDGELDKSLLRRTSGYMYKKGGAVNARGGFRTWKKRWFVLEEVSILGHVGYELQYFERPNENDSGGYGLKGAIGLSDIEILCDYTSSTQDPPTENKRNLSSLLASKPKPRYDFQIALQNGSTLELGCDSPIEREEWVDTLQIVAAFLKKVLTSSSMAIDGYDPCLEDDPHIYSIGKQLSSNCMAFGPGLFGSEAGQAVQFLVQIHDLVGQQVFRGGMPLTACITNYPPEDIPQGEGLDGEAEEKAIEKGKETRQSLVNSRAGKGRSNGILYHLAVQDRDDGTYLAHYVLGKKGKYFLSIRINDEHHIFGSPFRIEILSSKTDPRYCFCSSGEKSPTANSASTATGAVEGGYDESDEEQLLAPMFSSLRTDSKVSFVIIARDGYGNRKSKGGDPFEVGLLGPAQLLALQDNHDGSYTCKLQTTNPNPNPNPNQVAHSIAAASLVVMVTLHGKHVIGSPFKIALLTGLSAFNNFQESAPSQLTPPLPPAPPTTTQYFPSQQQQQQYPAPNRTPASLSQLDDMDLNKRAPHSFSFSSSLASVPSPSLSPELESRDLQQILGKEPALNIRSQPMQTIQKVAQNHNPNRNPSIDSSKASVSVHQQPAATPSAVEKPPTTFRNSTEIPSASPFVPDATPPPSAPSPAAGGAMSRLERARQRALLKTPLSESLNQQVKDGRTALPNPQHDQQPDPTPTPRSSSSKLSAVASRSIQILHAKKSQQNISAPTETELSSNPNAHYEATPHVDPIPQKLVDQPPLQLPQQHHHNYHYQQQQQQEQNRNQQLKSTNDDNSSRQSSKVGAGPNSAGSIEEPHRIIPSRNSSLANVPDESIGEISSALRKGLGTAVAPFSCSPEEQQLWDRTHSALSNSGVSTHR